MRRTTLTRSELNRRCDQVFDHTVSEYVYDVYVTNDNRVVVDMSRMDENLLTTNLICPTVLNHLNTF